MNFRALRGSLWRKAALLYLALLLLSSLWRLLPGEPELQVDGDVSIVELPVYRNAGAGMESGDASTHLAYAERAATAGEAAPTLLLLHGSPGSHHDFDALLEHLPGDLRILAVDLPGFGSSDHEIPDYSIAAHAYYCRDLLEHLGIERAHLLGFSMGGGVALHLAQIAPQRTASVTLLSSIGAQEYELFGNHSLNRAVHTLQLGAIWSLHHLTPHFGGLDDLPLDLPYARNFSDSDLRPLRELLSTLEQPLQIIHGEGDFLVPLEAAQEHARIAPHSELHVLAASHFLPWRQTAPVAELLSAWIARVETGQARTRSQASTERLELSRAPFDPSSVPPISGPAILVAMLLIALATLITEDGTCIATGLLIAQGRIAFLPGAFAAFAGIFIGDALLYLAGRTLGRSAVDRAPLRWLLRPESIERGAAWFEQKGGRVIFLARFLPGLRLPTYFAAGVVRAPFGSFCFFFLLAGLLWTPILVGLAVYAGERAEGLLTGFGRHALPSFVALVIGMLLLQRLIMPLFSKRGRRLMVGAVRRRLRWEFWPPWRFYPPVVLYVLWQALRYRSLSLLTAVNPGIPTGGFIGESKSDILRSFGSAADFLPAAVGMRMAEAPAELRERALAFLADNGLPLVLKPDVGQRGSGVHILRSREQLVQASETLAVDSLLQAHIQGEEFGVFYLRRPGSARGQVFSITHKVLPRLRGDGHSTLEELILADPRAVALASTYLALNASRLLDVPNAGEYVTIAELGTHCLGALFIDACDLKTPQLEEEMERISRHFEGFHFGRYDLIAPSKEALSAGRDLQVIELNGMTSEATHIYDARHGLLYAYSVLFEQWRLAFEIAAANRASGARTWSLGQLFKEWRAYRRMQKRH